jgi:hypothetical protein
MIAVIRGGEWIRRAKPLHRFQWVALFFLVGCATLALNAQDQATAETGARLDVPFTLAVKDNHIPWGKPGARAPIHALVVPSVSEGRTLVELAQRFPFTYDTVAIDTSWDVNTWTVGMGKDYGTRSYKMLYGYLADDLNSKTHYDVIVLPSLFGWNRLPQGVRDAILKRVRAGAGLVLIHPTTGLPAPDDPKVAQPLNKNAPDYAVSPGGKLWEVSPLVDVLSDRLDNRGHLVVRPDSVTTGTWKAVHRGFITDNVPVSSFPSSYLKHYKYRLGADSTVLVEGPNGEPIVATKMHGKGRVVALGYVNHGLSPKIDWDFYGKRDDHWWEYFYSLLGRSILWAGHDEPPMTLLPMNVIPSQSMGGHLVVPIQSSEPVMNKAELSLSVADQWGENEGTITREVRVKKGINKVTLTLPQNRSDGRHDVDVILSSGGKHYDWGTAVFATPQPDKVLTVTTDKPFYKTGDLLQVTVRTSGKERAKLRIEVLDNRGRVIGLKTETAVATDRGNFHVSLPVGNYSTNIGWVQATLFEPAAGKSIKLDQRKTRIGFVRLDRKFGAYELIMPWYGPPSYEPWAPTLDRQLRQVGITVGANPRDNFKIIDQLDAPGFGVYWFKRQPYIEQKDNFLRTHNTKYLIREPDLSSPTWMTTLRGDIVKSMQKEMPYHPLAYYLADESSLTAYNDPFDFSWSKSTLAALRQWLRGQYPSLDALNHEWETDFKSWDDVRPLTTAEAQAKGDYAGWMDHRTFMEQVFAHAMQVAAKTVKAEDPGGLPSISGTQAPGASNAINWYLLDHIVGYLQPYSVGDQDDLHRSIHAGQILTGFTGYGSVGVELQHELWHRLLHNQIGASVFWQYTALNPDLTLTEQGKGLAALTNEFRDEGLALLLRGAHRDNCGIAVHYSLLSLRGHWITDGHITPGKVVRSDVTSANLRRFEKDRTAWLQALRDANYQYDFLTTEQMDKGEISKYKVLILPDSIALSKDEARAIRAFVEKGGLLISDGETGLMDGHARWKTGGLLDSLLGIQSQNSRREQASYPSESIHGTLASQPVSLSVTPVAPDLKLTTGHASAKAGNTPFLIENSVGAGHSLVLNFWLTTFGHTGKKGGSDLGFSASNQSAGSKDDAAFLHLLRTYLTQAGVAPVADVLKVDGKPLRCSEIVRYKKGGEHYLAILPEMGCSDAGGVRVRFPKQKYVYNLRTHRFLGHVASATGTMSAGSPVFFADLSTPISKVTITPETASVGIARVKAGGRMQFLIRQSKTANAKSIPEAVHITVKGPDGKAIDYYSRNLSLVNGQVNFNVRTALSDPLGTWAIEVREPYTHQTSVARFDVTK